MASKFFSELVAVEHSTVAWLAKEIQKFDNEEPKIASVVDAGLNYVGPVLTIALDSLGQTAAASAVGSVISEAQRDLLTVNALVTDFGPTPTASSLLASVKTNLTSVLTDAHVTSSGAVAQVNKAINEISTLGTAIDTAATEISAAAGTTNP